MNPRKLQNIVPILMSILGIYVLSLGMVSAVFGRRYNLIYFDIIGISANILAAISVSVIYGVTGTLFLGNQFNYPVHDLYTAIYYSAVVLTTIGFGDIFASSEFLKTMKSKCPDWGVSLPKE